MKTLEETKVIVHVGPCECHGMIKTQVHHHDFPELEAEGETAAEAASHLHNQFLREIDSVTSEFRREAIEHALHDIHDFLEMSS